MAVLYLQKFHTSVVIMLAHHKARDQKSEADMFEARADGFSQLIGPLSKITVTHRKKEDTDDGENSKYDRERTGNKWCCKKGGQRQCERRQTEWQ